MYDVFISYRRKGGLDLAGRIKDHLFAVGFNPYYDVETMRSGFFPDQIYRHIDECKHFVLILPPHGLARCVFKNDWVRKEIEYAIKKRKHIITVCMPGFRFPKFFLPESLEIIKSVQAITQTPETFEHTLDKLVQYIKDPEWNPDEYNKYESKKNATGSSAPLTAAFFGLVVIAFLALLAIIKPWIQNEPTTDSQETSLPNEPTGTIDTVADYSPPAINIGRFDLDQVEIGGRMLCMVYFGDNIKISEDRIQPEMIEMDEGWTADVKVFSGENAKVIEFSNIQGVAGYHHFTIKQGAVVDTSGNESSEVQSFQFSLQNTDMIEPTVVISGAVVTNEVVKYTLYFDDDTTSVFLSSDPSRIVLVGFDGDVSFDLSTNQNSCVITIKNYEVYSDECFIVIPSGIAVDSAGNQSRAIKSSSFEVVRN